jgi:hypothetical protein
MPEMTVRVVDLRDYPAPQPFREPVCMPVKPEGWVAAECCGYHQADWGAINEFVVAQFVAFGTETVSFDEFRQAIERSCYEPGLFATDLNRMFANSIVDDPMLANDGWWVNGQHRAQAMLDAGSMVTLFVD